MKDQNVEIEKPRLSFEVPLEDLGKKTRLPSKLETKKLKLDVGCGSMPTGDVNVDFCVRGWNSQEGDQKRGEFLNPKMIPNFVVADAKHLPFRNNSFNIVFSSHTIEHVSDPKSMFAEMCRVAKRKVILRGPHRRGSGAKRPFHVNYLDETWFRNVAASMGYKCDHFISAFDYPISNRAPFPSRFRKGPFWRALRHFERRFVNQKIKIPFELEAWINKLPEQPAFDSPQLITVYNEPDFCQFYFKKRILFPNYTGEGLSAIYNEIAENLSSKSCWLVFCHQDFFLYEDLKPLLQGLDRSAVYGVIGARSGSNNFYGQVIQTDGSLIGLPLKKPEPVQTLDEMCIILHSSLFSDGLRFDNRFKFHFYGADLCLQAYSQGFDVKAIQVTCQHKSKTLHGDINSADYIESKRLFVKKWKRFLPVRTTTGFLEK
jgi:SAM-dependent methyltransferase